MRWVRAGASVPGVILAQPSARVISARRAKLPIPDWVLPAVAAAGLVSVAVKETYDDQIRRLWEEIRDDWLARERMLADDPRNGLAE
jgi:hypothetical protein